MKTSPFLYRIAFTLLLAVAIGGCFQSRQTLNTNPFDPRAGATPGAMSGAMSGTTTAYYPNPVPIPPGHPEQVWETVVDVLDDYFDIDREEPLRQVENENIVLEGQVDTFPQVAATILEPWRHDSANLDERIESTVQSMRRRATVRVVPDATGYQVEVVVYKELEDVVKPEHSASGAATFRYDDSLNRVVNPVIDVPVDAGWILLGRDTALEQRIIAQLVSRTGTTCVPFRPNQAQPLPGPGVTPSLPSGCGESCGEGCNPVPSSTCQGQPALTPVPESASFLPGRGNTWTQDPGSSYGEPARDWQPKSR